jgi:hypothetical protein
MSDTDPQTLDPTADAAAQSNASDAWRELVGQVGAEIAGPLSAALERIHVLTGTGRIDRRGLRALRNEVDAARQVGLVSQQIARLASGELSQAPERLQLSLIIKSVVAQRSRDIEARGVQIRQSLQPADIVVDAPLLFSLLNTLLDWALANARSHIEFRTDVKTWPAHARLTTYFAQATPERVLEASPSSGLDSLIWRLLQQTGHTMGLSLSRHVEDGHTELVIEFPQTEAEATLPEVLTPPATTPVPPVLNIKPLVGSHVLVAVADRDLKLRVRDSIKNMGLIVDFVESIEEAVDFCRDGLPHALVYEAALSGTTYDKLKSELLTEAPDFVFIEILNTRLDKDPTPGEAQVPEAQVAERLPHAVAAELSRNM